MTRRGLRLAPWCQDLLLPPLLGGLVTAGFAPYGYYGLTLIGLIGLLALWWQAPTPRRGAWRGWWFGVGYFGTGIYWVIVSTHVYGGAPLALGVFLVALLVAVLALFPAVIGGLAVAMRGLPRSVWALLAVPAAWLLLELARATIGTGFPWLSLGYTLIDAPARGLVPIVGVYGLGALLVAAAGTLWLLSAGGLFDRVLAAALVVVFPIGLWALPAPLSWTAPAGAPLSVAILQGNVDQADKWRPENLEPTKQLYRQLSADVDARLVIWPEAAIPSLRVLQEDYLDEIDQRAAQTGRTELIGFLVYDRVEEQFFNVVEAMGIEQGRYRKRHLVPFGEYFPVPDFIKPLVDGVNMHYSFTHGPVAQPLIEVDGIGLGISICFEDVFPREIRRALPAAGVLVNVTNDAWFADTSAPHQHLEIARMRALEAGRPLLRAANTGISAVIGPTGRVRPRTPQFEVATLEAEVTPRRGATPIVAYGNAPAWSLAVVLVVAGVGASRWRRKAA